MYRKQLGRRNLTEEQKTYMIGKMYEGRKNTASFKGNQYTMSGGAQNAPKHKRMSEILAEELGVGKDTVKRSEKFAKGVDAIREVSPDAAEKVKPKR